MRGALAFGLVIAMTARVHAEAPKPREPGIYPLLILHGFDGNAYILACAKVVRGKKPVMISTKACAPLIAKLPLEAIMDSGRERVKIARRGTGYACPEGKQKQQYFSLAGLPEDIPRSRFIVGVGEAERAADPVVMEMLRKKLGPKVGKSPKPQTWEAELVVDLDGDGVDEIVVSNLGLYELYRADGVLLGTVGCAFG
jgi:hypothetical protein